MRVRTPEFPCFCMMWHSDGSRKALMWVKNITQFWRFWYLNMSQNKYYFNLYEFLKKGRICTKIQRQMFLLVSSTGRHISYAKGTPTRCLHTKLFNINVGKTLFQISSIWSIAQTWFLARLFVYSSSFVSQILDFLDWMVCIFIFNGVTEWKQKIEVYENYRGWVDVCYSNLFFILSRNLLQSLFQAAR